MTKWLSIRIFYLAHNNSQFQAEVAAYDLVHDLALEMADFFSNGVMRQFPRTFKGRIM